MALWLSKSLFSLELIAQGSRLCEYCIDLAFAIRLYMAWRLLDMFYFGPWIAPDAQHAAHVCHGMALQVLIPFQDNILQNLGTMTFAQCLLENVCTHAQKHQGKCTQWKRPCNVKWNSLKRLAEPFNCFVSLPCEDHSTEFDIFGVKSNLGKWCSGAPKTLTLKHAKLLRAPTHSAARCRPLPNAWIFHRLPFCRQCLVHPNRRYRFKRYNIAEGDIEDTWRSNPEYSSKRGHCIDPMWHFVFYFEQKAMDMEGTALLVDFSSPALGCISLVTSCNCDVEQSMLAKTK